MSFDSEHFEETGTGAGTVHMEMMGQKMDMPFEGTYYLNGAGTIAAAAADVGGRVGWVFLSATGTRDVMTVMSKGGGDPVEIDGTLLNITQSEDRDELLASHLAAVGDDAVADPDGLKAAIQDSAQRAADLSSKALDLMMKAFQG